MNNCLECGKVVKVKFCDRSCQNRYYWKKPEYRKKMSFFAKKTWNNPIAREKLSKARKVFAVNRWKDENQRKKQSVIRKKYCDSAYGKNQLIDSATKRSIEKPDSWGKNNFKSGWFFSKKNNLKLFHHSSYELLAFNILEQQDNVVRYEKCKFSVDYIKPDDGIIHKYIPDILVVYDDGRKQIIEIKAGWQLNDEINKAKFSYVKEYCDINNMLFSV